MTTEPDENATDEQLAAYYDQHHDTSGFGTPRPVQRPERLDVTISVRFTADELAAVRARAAAAGIKPTTYIRRCALSDERSPIDRTRLSRATAALARDLEDLRRAAS